MLTAHRSYPPCSVTEPMDCILYALPRLNRTGGLGSRHHPVPSTPAQAADDAYISYRPVAGLASPSSRPAMPTITSSPALVARGSCSLAAPSLTAGITASRVSSRDLAMGPVSCPRSSRSAGRHVTAQHWRQQAACQRSPRASARLALAPPRACQRRSDTPARRLPRTAPAPGSAVP
jgi:hypothetical protein